jgi:hypothetical protein
MGLEKSSGGSVPGQIDYAETFTESDVTTSLNDTIIVDNSIGFGSGEMVNDFEDGNTTPSTPWNAYTGDTGSFSTQTSTVLSGSYSGSLNASGVDVQVVTKRGSEVPANLSFLVRTDAKHGSSFDESSIGVFDGGGNEIGTFRLNDNTGDAEWSGSSLQTLFTYSANTTYNVTLQFDWSENNVEIDVGGTVYGPFGFQNGANGLAELRFANNASSSGNTRNLFWDDLETNVVTTSGNAIIEWPYPNHVFEWGGVYFDGNGDGATIDIYIEEYDGSSWVEIAGPISTGDTIPANPDRNVRFRVELSRTDTANNPRLHQIARREIFKA